MILFKKKPLAPEPVAPQQQSPAARAEQDVRREETAALRRKKADSDGTLRRMRQTAQDNRLL